MIVTVRPICSYFISLGKCSDIVGPIRKDVQFSDTKIKYFCAKILKFVAAKLEISIRSVSWCQETLKNYSRKMDVKLTN